MRRIIIIAAVLLLSAAAVAGPQKALKGWKPKPPKGFVEMTNDADAGKAIEALNGKEIKGKVLSVEKAKPKKVNIWS